MISRSPQAEWSEWDDPEGRPPNVGYPIRAGSLTAGGGAETVAGSVAATEPPTAAPGGTCPDKLMASPIIAGLIQEGFLALASGARSGAEEGGRPSACRVPIPISIAVFFGNTTSFPRATKCE